jgi:putative CocE/NonD family hydrolase
MVFQLIRGIGRSEGTFTFNSPEDRTDGYDTVEWIAAQPWCDGNVGMDGGSYLGMTQLTAATTRPPHLKCIVPSVPTADPFREVPYFGGGFTRHHSLTWLGLIAAESAAELTGGFTGVIGALARPEWFRRLTVRPVVTAADDLLRGDKLAYYRDALAHPTFDDWWRARTLGPDDWARIEVPALVVSGSFDLSVGAMTVWHGLERDGPAGAERSLLIGPWDHSGSYIGGRPRYGPHELDGWDAVDPFTVRLAFFDRHLRGRGAGPDLGGRVKLYLTGANEWRSFDRFPPAEVVNRRLYLRGNGGANALRGDGRLAPEPPAGVEPADRFVDDPELPFLAAMSQAGRQVLDLRERGRHSETLAYSTPPLDAPLTIVGEPEVVLHTAADAPDADLAAWLAESRPDGALVQLSYGHLRLRYRAGFDREVLLEPGVPVEARVRMHYVAHRLRPGHALVLLVSGGNFPWVDPNPHTGAPIATAATTRTASQIVLHDRDHPSLLELPVLPP